MSEDQIILLRKEISELKKISEDKVIENAFYNLNQVLNYFKYIMTINFAIIPITITMLAFFIDYSSLINASYYLIGSGLILAVVNIVLCFRFSFPSLKPMSWEHLADVIAKTKKSLWGLLACSICLMITIALITSGFIVSL